MDMLLLDECGQLSSQQFALMDIVCRHSRNSLQPFEGVPICGSFDHCQIESIDGLPFLISLHILLDYTIVCLEHSVRASRDKQLQVSAPIIIQPIVILYPEPSGSHIYVFKENTTDHKNESICVGGKSGVKKRVHTVDE